MSLVAMKVWIRGDRCAFERLAGALDVRLPRSREPAHAQAAHFTRDRAHRLEIAIARDRETRFEHVDAESLELARQRELLGEVHAATGRLFAVAQRGVEDADDLAHDVVSGDASGGRGGSFSSGLPEIMRQTHSIGPDST